MSDSENVKHPGSRLEVRDIKPEDYARQTRLEAVSFHMAAPRMASPEEAGLEIERRHQDDELRFGINQNKIRYLGTYLDSKLVAAAHIVPYVIRFDGQDCDTGGIAGVVSDPAVRRRGTVRALIQQALAEMKESGQILSYLHPLSRLFYSQFGFELSAERVAWTVPVEFLPRPDSDGIEHYTGQEDQRREIIAIYRAFTAAYNMALQRDEKVGWPRFFRNIEPYRTDQFSYLSRDEQGQVNAFLSYRLLRNNPGEVVADASQAFYFTSARGLKTLLAFLAGLAGYVHTVRFNLPPDVDLNPWLPEYKSECKAVRREIQTFGMARVVDAAAVLACARYQGSGSLTVEVTDGQCPWNNRRFAVRFTDARADVTVLSASDVPADLELDIQALTSLITGRRSIDEAEYIPSCQVNGNLENLRKAFYRKRIWLDDFF